MSTDTEIASALSSHFENAALELTRNINFNLNEHREYLTKVYDPGSFNPITIADTKKIIRSLKQKRSTGFDGISNKLIKACSDSLCDPLTRLINQSINEGIFPECLKIAKVIPIYKKVIN